MERLILLPLLHAIVMSLLVRKCLVMCAMRKECGCELFSENDVPSKYSLKVYAEETNIPQAVVNPDVQVSVNPSARRILNSTLVCCLLPMT